MWVKGAMEGPSSRSGERASLQPRGVTACLKALGGGRKDSKKLRGRGGQMRVLIEWSGIFGGGGGV